MGSLSKHVVTVAVIVATATSCSSSATSHTAAPSTMKPVSSPQLDCRAQYLSKFTLRQKLAQLLTVGVKNTADAVNVERTEQIGGLFIGSWTDRALLANHEMQLVNAIALVPPLVTIDEEGGRVDRLKDLIGAMPSARDMAATMTVEQVQQLFADRGRAMRDLGITVDFAPDADVNDGDPDGVIGDRSYSGDPQTVTAYAGAAVRGLHDAGLGAVIKHFPGHGHGSGDSHKAAVTTPALSQLQQVDLAPFRNLVGSGAAVMVGHLDVPGLTQPGVPASISPQAMSLLRDGTGYHAPPFSGVIFTDDLGGMAAITSRMDIPHAVEAALEAGADDALWISTDAVPQVLDRLEQAVNSGRLPGDRVNQSVLRVARYKGLLTC